MVKNLSKRNLSIAERRSRLPVAYRVGIIALALLYGIVLASLPLEALYDRPTYIFWAGHSEEILRNFWSQGILVTLANEPLWWSINIFLSFFFTPEGIVRTLIIIPAIIVAYLILQADPKHFIWLLLFLFVPGVIRHHIMAIRQGVAVAIFLLAWFSTNKYWRRFLFLLTPLVHVSFFIVLVLMALTWLVRKMRFAYELRSLAFLCIGIAMGIGGMAWLGEMVGSRQAEALTIEWYAARMPEASGLGALFWTMIFVIYSLQGKVFTRNHTFELGSIIFYISTYHFLPIAGRIFTSILPVVLLAGLELTGWRRLAFGTLVLSWVVLYYGLRWSQPWLGFGV